MSDLEITSDGIILILGATGAGKSYFCNQLVRHCVQEGHSLRSETTQCQAIEIKLDDDDDDKQTSIAIVDTPGFDDTTRPHGEVLAEITEFLAAQHAVGIPLRGVLYLHKITDNKMTGSSLTYLRLFESLVGDEAMKNAILVTTMWNKVRDEDIGEALRREQELLDDFWRPMREKGSYVAQFDGTPDAAYALIWQLAGKNSVVLQVQKEMDGDAEVTNTAAGNNLLEQLQGDKVAYTMQLSRIDAELEGWTAQVDKDTARRLRREKDEVEALLRRIDRSIVQMHRRPGVQVKERIKQAMSGRGATRAISVLAAVLNIALFVVKVTGGG